MVCGVTAAATPGPRHGRSEASFSDATPAEVRAALVPEEAAEFDQQWREVMAAATEALAPFAEARAMLEVAPCAVGWCSVPQTQAGQSHASLHVRSGRTGRPRLILDDLRRVDILVVVWLG
jgi:hypothetical protein